MNQKEAAQFKFSTMVIAIPLYLVLFLWVVLWLEGKYGLYFTKYGVYPRTLSGLKGIVLSPFIHGGTSHLMNNSVPLFVLMTTLFYFYRRIAFKILVWGAILSGFITWLIARDAYHIGASGIVYLLFSFILFSGLIRKYYRLVAVSLIVVFLYGSMIWYILPIKEGISWEGHLSGFLVGLVFAIIFRKYGPQKMMYEWEADDYVDSWDEEEE